jgi:hypothetical protein
MAQKIKVADIQPSVFEDLATVQFIFAVLHRRDAGPGRCVQLALLLDQVCVCVWSRGGEGHIRTTSTTQHHHPPQTPLADSRVFSHAP